MDQSVSPEVLRGKVKIRTREGDTEGEERMLEIST